MEPLSTNSDEFRQRVYALLHQSGELLIFKRLAYTAGAGAGWYLVRQQKEFDTLLDTAPSKAAFSIMLEPELRLRGIADDDLRKAALILLEQEEELLLFFLRSVDLELDYRYASSEAQVHKLFDEHQGEKVAIGRIPPWFDDSEAITGYVPDADGMARPGAY